MTDGELLELAANAAGIECKKTPIGFYLSDEDRNWNPLTDDGDALRLAVKLRIDIDLWIMKDSVAAKTNIGAGRGIPLQGEYKPPLNDHSEPLGTDPYAATRRAITRAAAEIGKAK